MQGIKVISVSKSAISDTVLMAPSIEEQNRISATLNGIDYLITLHQGKLECSIGSRNPSAKDIRIEIHGPIRDNKGDEPLMPVVRIRPAIARMNGLNGSLSGVSKGRLRATEKCRALNSFT